MAFETPTLDEELEFLVAHMAHLFPDADLSEGSPNWLWLKTFAAGVTGNHAHIDAAKNDLFPDTAVAAELVRWGTIKGVIQKGATPARKSLALRVFGTPTTVVPNARAMVHQPTGLQFQTASTDVIGAGNYVDVDVVAIDVGSVTRLSTGENLTFMVTPAGLEDDAELQLDMDEDGTDVEDDGNYRTRQLKRWSDPPLGGARSDYEDWATAVTGIATAYVYPLRAGVGTVDLAALHVGSGSDRLLLGGEITALQAVITAKRPVSGSSAVGRVLTVTAAPNDIEYTALSNGDLEHEFDWDDTVPPHVLAWNAGTRTLQFVADRPPSMQAGHRLTFSGGASGAERVIESLSSTDSVVLELDAGGDTPAGTVYSGGPLVQPIRAAIQALVDSFGPANPDSKRYGPWEGNLRPGAINRVASTIDGVLDGTVVFPVATVTAGDPAYPDDGTVELITLRQNLVRKQH